MLPVFSFLWLKGKCRKCGQKIGMMSFTIELVAALIGAVPVLVLPESQAIAAAVFGWLLLPLIILDYLHLWLPNRLVLLLAAMGLLTAPMLTPDINWFDRFLGLTAGFLTFEVIRQAYKKYQQRDGMGAGDPKLFGALGIWLGWQALPMTLLIASTIGLISIFIVNLITNHSRTTFPFGSYLGIAAYLMALMV